MLLTVNYYNYEWTFSAIINLLPLLAFFLWNAIKREQNSFYDIVVQLTFIFYLIGLLNEAIFFIPFASIAASLINGSWLNEMATKIDNIIMFYEHIGMSAYGVNLVPLRKFADYSLLHRQVIGNFVMLFPLGFYLPLLYKKTDSIKKVLLTCFLSH